MCAWGSHGVGGLDGLARGKHEVQDTCFGLESGGLDILKRIFTMREFAWAYLGLFFQCEIKFAAL